MRACVSARVTTSRADAVRDFLAPLNSPLVESAKTSSTAKRRLSHSTRTPPPRSLFGIGIDAGNRTSKRSLQSSLKHDARTNLVPARTAARDAPCAFDAPGTDRACAGAGTLTATSAPMLESVMKPRRVRTYFSKMQPPSTWNDSERRCAQVATRATIPGSLRSRCNRPQLIRGARTPDPPTDRARTGRSKTRTRPEARSRSPPFGSADW